MTAPAVACDGGQEGLRRTLTLITHAVHEMLRQRVYGLALGWEDLNDHRSLRSRAWAMAPSGFDDDLPFRESSGQGFAGSIEFRLAVEARDGSRTPPLPT